MKVFFTRYYEEYLDLEGAVCHFYDELAGKINANLYDDNDKFDHVNNIYDGSCLFENDMRFDIEIFWDDEQEEWVAKAYLIED